MSDPEKGLEGTKGSQGGDGTILHGRAPGKYRQRSVVLGPPGTGRTFSVRAISEALEIKPLSGSVAHLKPRSDLTREGVQKAPRGFRRFWELFSYILPHRVRERVFEPAFNELLEDYLEIRGRYRTRWAKRWLTVAFTFRTVLMVADCIRAILADRAVRFISRLLPEPLKHWWTLR